MLRSGESQPVDHLRDGRTAGRGLVGLAAGAGSSDSVAARGVDASGGDCQRGGGGGAGAEPVALAAAGDGG